MFPPPLFSPLLHHTIPAGANLRLTVYRRITRLHLSNLGPHLYPPPREGAVDQEKGRNGGRSEREKCARVPQDWFLSVWIRKWECDNRRGAAQTSLCVCMCLRVCAHACVCMDLVELRCHVCEDHSFELVATRDDALNHRNARDDCAVICVWMCVCLLGHLMEINTTFRVRKGKCFKSMSPWKKSERCCHILTLYTHTLSSSSMILCTLIISFILSIYLLVCVFEIDLKSSVSFWKQKFHNIRNSFPGSVLIPAHWSRWCIMRSIHSTCASSHKHT